MKYKTHSKDSKEKEKIFIHLEIVDSYYKVLLVMSNKMLAISKPKKNRCDFLNTMQYISKE